MEEALVVSLFVLVSVVTGTPINAKKGLRKDDVYHSECDGYILPCYARPESLCEMRRRIVGPNWAKPVCNLDGSFREYQCEPYSRSKCWCVYDNGMMIPGSEKDLYDENRDFKQLNCAEARAHAPPAPNPPPIEIPFRDPRLGWHLAYRDAELAKMKKYYHGYLPSYFFSNSGPAPAPYPNQVSVVSHYMAPYTGSCVDPCPEPCPCKPLSEGSPMVKSNAAQSEITGSGDEKDETYFEQEEETSKNGKITNDP